MTTHAPPPPPPPPVDRSPSDAGSTYSNIGSPSAANPYHRTASTGSVASSSAGAGAGQQDDKLAALLQSPNFTVASYLNLALDLDKYPPAPLNNGQEVGDEAAKQEDDEDEDARLQRRMAELALQLQVSTQSCHDEIGRIGAELRAILPRCAADVDRLGQGLDGMRDDAEGLLLAGKRRAGAGGGDGGGGGRDEETSGGAGAKIDTARQTSSGKLDDQPSRQLQQVDQLQPTPAISTLSTLHSLRTNLQQTRSILSAASSWDATLSSIPSLLSTQNLTDAVSALAKLEDGERALGGMPGRDERRDAISRIRGQIEVLLKPQLLHALQRMDTRLGPLQSCVAMYGQLGKVDSLCEEYVRQRPGKVQKEWFGFVPPSPVVVSGGAAAASAGAGTGADLGEDGLYEKGREDGRANDGGPPTDAADDVVDSAKTAAAAAEAFLGWLPGWYDAVLSLLTEERRRATAVFGPRLAPEIIVRVLGECFRPILPSFKTRLASLCSPDVGGDASIPTSKSASAGSLESVCAAYESTLQFLSQAYDQMAASFDAAEVAAPVPAAAAASTGSLSEGGDSSAAAAAAAAGGAAKSPLEVYSLVRSTFTTVASPFTPYQRGFAAIELRHSGLASAIVARDVQAAVSDRSAGTTLASLQDAVDRLGGLAPYLFPLAEGAVARFELLNCGYNPNDAMSTVDSLLASHAGELAIAVGTLTANMIADEDRLADSFDEEHVQCALEILKVAGTFKDGLAQFEDKTRETLRTLLGRMAANVEHDLEVRVASKGGSVAAAGGSSSSSLIIPDSLSAVEVEAMLSKAVCGDEQDGDGDSQDEGDEEMEMPSLTLLQRLSSGPMEGVAHPDPLFPDAVEAVTRLAGTCHVFVFDVCSAVPRRSLRSMSTLPVWRKESGVMDALSYGVLPQQYITQVGEHMLALVQALEPFASDRDALALANMVMDGAKNVALQPWKEFAAAIGGVDANRDEVISALMSGKDLADHVIRIADENDAEGVYEDDEEQDEEEEDEDAKATNAFCNQWLDVVGSAVTGRLLERMLRVHHLSEKGCEQLAVDLKYLINVFAALGVAGHPHPLLGHFAEVSEMKPDELREKILSRDTSNAVVSAVRGAEVRMALMRGITIN